MKKLLAAVAVVIAIAVFSAAYLGVAQVPVLSSALGMDRPRDLGVRPDPVARQACIDKYGIQRPSDPANYGLGNEHEFSGGVDVGEVLTQENIAAIPELQNGSKQFKNVQFRFHEGKTEISLWADNPGGYPVSGPVYAIAEIQRSGDKSVSIHIDKLEFGRLGVPSEVLKQAESAFNDYVNSKLAEIPELRIDLFRLHDGNLEFKGRVPKVVKAKDVLTGTGLP
jgi:hypothetical protein